MIGGGELLNEVKSYAENLPVTFAGWLDKPFASAEYFDLLLLTSKNEGMGLVILEAANYARPTISRDIGGVREFIEDNVSGFLVDGNSELMAKRILDLNKELCDRVGANAKLLLSKNFSDVVLAKKYYEFYKSLLD
jgi:glycosyltransferase involved in cell wall biosynthesis